MIPDPQPTLSTATALGLLLKKIADLRRRTLRAALVRALTRGTWAWLLSLLLFTGVARGAAWPGPTRLGLIALQGALVALAAGSALDRRLLRRDPRAWALRCEELHPALQERLVTCLDLLEREGGPAVFETNPLARALLGETSARLVYFDPARAAGGRLGRAALLLAVAPLLILGGWFWFAHQQGPREEAGPSGDPHLAGPADPSSGLFDLGGLHAAKDLLRSAQEPKSDHPNGAGAPPEPGKAPSLEAKTSATATTPGATGRRPPGGRALPPAPESEQTLEQSATAALPAEYRAMAAQYFTALGATSETQAARPSAGSSPPREVRP